jgi:hypothetical protein
MRYGPCLHIGATLFQIRSRQEKYSEATIADLARLFILPWRRLTLQKLEQMRKLHAQLSSFKSVQLGDKLRANNQKSSGTKEQRIQRCIDCILHGNLPKCPRCSLGKLYLADGVYRCHGSFFSKSDADSTVGVKKCSFVARSIDREALMTFP